MNFNQLLLKSIKASIEAGNAILDVYHSDKRSHEIIVNSLKEFDIPIPHTPLLEAVPMLLLSLKPLWKKSVRNMETSNSSLLEVL